MDLLNGVTKIGREGKMENFATVLKYWPYTCTVKVNYFFGGHFCAFKLYNEIFSFVNLLDHFGNVFGPFQVVTDCQSQNFGMIN